MMTTRSMTRTVDGIPNIAISQAEEDVVIWSQQEDKAGLPELRKKTVRLLLPATEPVSSSPLAVTGETALQRQKDLHINPRRCKVALRWSTAKARQQLPALLQQPVSFSLPAASRGIPLLCRDDCCSQSEQPIFEDVTYEVQVCDCSQNCTQMAKHVLSCLFLRIARSPSCVSVRKGVCFLRTMMEKFT